MMAVTRLLTGVLLRRPCHHDWPGEHCARMVVDGCLPLTEVGLAIERLERLAHVVVDLDKPRVMPMCAAEVCGDIKEEETPRSTEPPISERDLLRRAVEGKRAAGWFAIRSTSSRSSVLDLLLLTKAVSKNCVRSLRVLLMVHS